MDLTKTATALQKQNYQVSCFSTIAEAAAYLHQQIDHQLVDFGDSETKSLFCDWQQQDCPHTG